MNLFAVNWNFTQLASCWPSQSHVRLGRASSTFSDLHSLLHAWGHDVTHAEREILAMFLSFFGIMTPRSRVKRVGADCKIVWTSDPKGGQCGPILGTRGL
jgi:hypothetical protein